MQSQPKQCSNRPFQLLCSAHLQCTIVICTLNDALPGGRMWLRVDSAQYAQLNCNEMYCSTLYSRDYLQPRVTFRLLGILPQLLSLQGMERFGDYGEVGGLWRGWEILNTKSMLGRQFCKHLHVMVLLPLYKIYLTALLIFFFLNIVSNTYYI